MISTRKILSTFLFLLFFGCLSIITPADTGTYTILDYSVKLTPHSDGTVEIEYYQKWLVTSGHIPWITIGTANRNYRIDQSKNKGNIKSIYSYSSSGWSGIRIDLDKDYLPDETFEVGFTLIQSKLFYADKENYRLDFTPGWYDRAVTEKLTVIIHIFAPIDQVKVFPRNARIEGEQIMWEVANLDRGRKFPISISFPKSIMPQANTSALKVKKGIIDKIINWFVFLRLWLVLVVIFFAIIIIIKIIGATISGIKYSKKRGIYFAGFQWQSSGSTGGGGGFGGRSSSCACACASCACACACAGGGGAGCSKKTIHSCPLFSEVKKN
jgi:hypothetical protein